MGLNEPALDLTSPAVLAAVGRRPGWPRRSDARGMRVLVYPALMEIGGSQINAIELAHGAARRGHDVIMFGPDGRLVETVDALGLEYVRAPREHRWPSARNARFLTRLVRERGIDVVHGYEWGPCLDIGYGPHLLLGTPMVTTVLSMDVSRFLPRHAPMVVGTRQLADRERARGAVAELIEPPIDTAANRPSPAKDDSRAHFGLHPDDIVLAVVCRMTSDLGKADGVLEAIDVMGELAAREPLRLLVVGEGTRYEEVAARARTINARLGRDAVLVMGGILDPRPAYDAADVVLGMGSSALKGMAFAKPLIVQGEHGFWCPLDPESLPMFLQQGWFGHGRGAGDAEFRKALELTLARRSEWSWLGALGREVVERHYSLERAIDRQLSVYEQAISSPPPRAAAAREMGLTALKLAKAEAALKWRRAKQALKRDAVMDGATA